MVTTTPATGPSPGFHVRLGYLDVEAPGNLLGAVVVLAVVLAVLGVVVGGGVFVGPRLFGLITRLM